MELGNLFFGHSRGEYPLPRGVGLEEELFRLFDACTPEKDSLRRDYGTGVEFENDTFFVFPYYWGDCTCGYNEREERWLEKNAHQEWCYQTSLERAMKEWLGENPEPNIELFRAEGISEGDFLILSLVPNEDDGIREWHKWYKKREEFISALYDELCARFGVSRKFGAAVHCTCDYDERFKKFYDEYGHSPDCRIIRPNFYYKPTGLAIMWYKYPLRDSYSNQPITPEEFRKIIDACIKSVQADGKEKK